MDIDLLDPKFIANPFPTFTRLRAESPIHPVTFKDGSRAWLITRYDDALSVLQDGRFVKNPENAMTPEQLAQKPPLPEPLELIYSTLLDIDPPDHTRLRTLVRKAFTPDIAERLRPRIQEIADELLDAVQPLGKMDLIDEFAFLLPIAVIAEMLGLPIEDRDKFREWSYAMIADDLSLESQQHLVPLVREVIEYFRVLFAKRRACLSNDLISALLEAEEAGDKLSEKELYSMVILLLVAGHETTVNLIGNGVLALLEHPDQLALLEQHPELIDSAIEELLRYDGAVEFASLRYASEDVKLGETIIARGEIVMVVLASANRDERRFANPDRLDFFRSDSHHLAFGHGIHFCLGAPLARMEAKIAINTLLRRMPNIRLNVDRSSLSWRSSLVVRGLHRLPVAF